MESWKRGNGKNRIHLCIVRGFPMDSHGHVWLPEKFANYINFANMGHMGPHIIAVQPPKQWYVFPKMENNNDPF